MSAPNFQLVAQNEVVAPRPTVDFYFRDAERYRELPAAQQLAVKNLCSLKCALRVIETRKQLLLSSRAPTFHADGTVKTPVKLSPYHQEYVAHEVKLSIAFDARIPTRCRLKSLLGFPNKQQWLAILEAEDHNITITVGHQQITFPLGSAYFYGTFLLDLPSVAFVDGICNALYVAGEPGSTFAWREEAAWIVPLFNPPGRASQLRRMAIASEVRQEVMRQVRALVTRAEARRQRMEVALGQEQQPEGGIRGARDAALAGRRQGGRLANVISHPRSDAEVEAAEEGDQLAEAQALIRRLQRQNQEQEQEMAELRRAAPRDSDPDGELQVPPRPPPIDNGDRYMDGDEERLQLAR